MDIRLKNYKCFINFEISLPSKGLILFRGLSGAGKSTFFKALSFGFFGEIGKIHHKDVSISTKTEVEIKTKDYHLLRSKNPKKLQFTLNGVMMNDVIAQIKIDEMFCDFIMKGETDFVMFTPQDKLSFIESIFLPKSEVIKKIVRSKLSEREKILSESEIQVRISHSNVEQLEKPPRTDVSVPPFTEAELYKIKSALEQIETLKTMFHKIDDGYEEKKKLYLFYKIENEKFRKYVEYNKNIQITYTQEEIEYKKNTLKHMLAEVEKYKNNQRLLKLIDSTIPDISPDLEPKIIKMDLLKKQVKNLKDVNIHIIQKCPYCMEKIEISGDKLEKTNLDPMTYDRSIFLKKSEYLYDQEVIREIKSLNIPQNYTLEMLTKSRKNIQLRTQLVCAINDDEFEKYKKEILCLNEDIKQNDIRAETNKIYQRKIQALGKVEFYPNENTFSQTIKKNDEQLSINTTINNKIQILEKEIQKMDIIMVNQYIQDFKDDVLLKKYNKKTEELKKNNLIHEVNLRKYNNILKIKDIVREVECSVFKSSLSTISLYMNYFLGLFFDDEISYTLEYETDETSKKVIQRIKYKGYDFALNMFSSGEINRINIAFYLSMNKMFDTPIILLDEKMVNLDQEKITKICTIVRENFPEKLVLFTSHNTMEGIFDDIIDISYI